MPMICFKITGSVEQETRCINGLVEVDAEACRAVGISSCLGSFRLGFFPDNGHDTLRPRCGDWRKDRISYSEADTSLLVVVN